MPEIITGSFSQVPAPSPFVSATAPLGLVNRVLNYIHGPTDTTLTDIAKEAVNDGVHRLNTRFWNWSIMAQDITLVAGTRQYAIATNFNAPRSAELVTTGNYPKATIRYLEERVFLERLPNREASGDPDFYTVFSPWMNGLVTLDKDPTAATIANYQKLRLHFYERLNLFSADADTLFTIGNAPSDVEPFIVWHGRSIVAAHLAPDAADRAERQAEFWWRALITRDQKAAVADY